MKRELSLEVYSHFYKSSRQERHPPPAQATPEKTGQDKKKNKHPYAYYRQFRPVFLLLKLFGRIPLKVNSNGEYSCRLLSPWMAYCVLMYALQTYLAVIVCIRRLQALVDSQRDYDEFIFSIHILAYLNIHFHVPFTFWLQAGRVAHYLKQWADLQDDWAKTFGEPFQLVYSRTIRVYICLVVPLILGFLVFEQYATLRDPILYFIPYFITLVSTALVIGLWFCTCLEVRRLSHQLSEKLVQRLEIRTAPWQVSRWRLLWLELRAVTESLGTDLCAVLASIMATFSTTFLLGLYNGLVQLIAYGLSWKAVGYLSASFSSLTIIFVICDGGHRATAGVVSCTLSSLLKGKLSLANQELRHEVVSCTLSSLLKGKLSLANQELRHEIYLLVETIKADPPEIQLGGFVTLNRPLVVSLVSNTLTYLIVLLQFKVNEEEQETKPE